MDKLIATPVGAFKMPVNLSDLHGIVSGFEASHGTELQIRDYGVETVVFTKGEFCGCGACIALIDPFLESWLPLSSQRMIFCEECGNKRCPHAWSHDYVCGHSNEPGQEPVLIQKES